LLEEIGKQHKKFVACCDRKNWQDHDTSTIADKCSLLARLLKADVIVTQPANLASIQQGITGRVEVVSISDVSESRCEDKRREMSRLDAPLDQITPAAIEELLGRAVRYSPTLRVFDFRMVGSPKRTKHYLAGIQFLASIWERWCVVGEPTSRTIELYTVGNTQTQNGHLSGAEANTRVEEHIERPLSEAITASVTHCVKQDIEPSIFHTRGFVVKGRAYTIDPGFDAIGLKGPVRRCVFNASLAAEKHFAECRGLRTLDDSKGADGAVIDAK
jgi:hypothetical protein